MQTEPQAEPTPMWMVILGWILTLLPALALIASGTVKFMGVKPPEGAPNVGWAESAFFGLGLVEVGCAVLYLFPRTALLGAILVTGYLGGAVATHVRIGDQFSPPIVIGVLVWFGLLLRDDRVRGLLPWRRPSLATPTGGFLAAFGKVLLTLIVLIALIGGLIAALPTDFSVERSTTIDAPPSEVFAQVNDFHKWAPWNPWLKGDDTAKVTIEGAPSGKGAVYKWAGEKVGEGTMTILESRPNELIRIKLEFAKPMEGIAQTDFVFKAKDDKTAVTWSMKGTNNYVGKAFAFALGIEKMIGEKYEDGLKNMKTVVEAKKQK
ncbi:MAG: SRPBCC family protein [Planctomycetes bacterium]|nr:SRPBCC family protein [Planctomycetota bacterium]